ncbi:hypothetical protein Prudu_009944 [Prunus dulcis]|uniref:Uncharacterized protein n=1 Tax=Prunus dulcis TaxID=3755 RepID=A0A4Y1R792_PRUDU|nr:hypothetical protein Prudu_009944 [Prunus dulcis]
METLVIDCPNLFSISFDCCAFDKFILNNASSLVEFHVDMVHLIYRSYRYWSKVVRLLLQAPNVKHLNVQNWWFKWELCQKFKEYATILSRSLGVERKMGKFLTSKEDSFPKSFMLHNLNLLELRTGFTQYDLVGMAALLKLCPNLETMILEYLFKKRADESLSEELLNKPVELSMPSLKQVTMNVYTGTEDEFSVMKMLIGQGVVLEKIVFVPVQVENGKVVERSLPPVVLCRNGSQGWKCSPDLSSSVRNIIESELKVD